MCTFAVNLIKHDSLKKKVMLGSSFSRKGSKLHSILNLAAMSREHCLIRQMRETEFRVNFFSVYKVRARLYQASALTLRHRCDDTHDSVLIEKSRVT